MKAYVLHSGGMDSTTCLYMAAKAFGAENIVSCSFDYGQRHSKEMEMANVIAKGLGCQRAIFDMPPPPKTMLTDTNQEVPDISYAEIEGVSPTYVPFRNGQLIALLAAQAQGDKEAEAIYFGAHSEDAAGWAYPDCTPEFNGAMANAVYIGTYHQIRLLTPLQYDMKADVVRRGTELGVPWELTWSCYKGEEHHCGTCPTCISRREAFGLAGVKDPTVYQCDIDLVNVSP